MINHTHKPVWQSTSFTRNGEHYSTESAHMACEECGYRWIETVRTNVEDITISGYAPREGVGPGVATSMVLTCNKDGWTCVEEDFIGVCEECNTTYTLPTAVYKLVTV